MTRSELLALAEQCKRMVRVGMNLADSIAFFYAGEAAEKALGPLPNDLLERAAALRARAEEVGDE